MLLHPGTLLQDRYEIRGALEAACWTATDLRLGREVLVRAIPLPPPDDTAAFAELERRTAALAALTHAGLQTLLDFVYFAGQAYAIAKPTLGHSLADHLWQGPLPWPEARRILDGVLHLLEAVHARGLPHLRLGAQAVLLEPDGGVTLRHFAQGRMDLLPHGDPHRAPELDRGEASIAADLFACGALVPDLLGSDSEAWPEEALRFQRLLCDPDPMLRPASAKAARALLDAPAAPPERRFRVNGRIAAAAFLLLALLGWGAHHFGRTRTSPLQLDPESRATYLQAREHFTRRTAEDLWKAEAGYRAVLARHPDCAEAWSGLAVDQALLGVYGLVPHREALAKARESVRRAQELDPRSGEAAVGAAYLDLRFEWKWKEADEGFRRAVALTPESALIRHWRGFQLSLSGHPAAAVEELSLAHRLDPVDRQITTNLAVAQIWAGDAKGGLDLLEELIYHDPHFSSARDRLRMALEAEGRIPEALGQGREIVRIGMWPEDYARDLEQAFRKEGAPGYFRMRLVQIRHPYNPTIEHYFEAQVLALAGDKAEAFRALELAVAQHSLFLIWGPQDPALRSLHSDPRWAAFLASIHYPTA
jgi:tetratricopeptide (TPR) repeat protein